MLVAASIVPRVPGGVRMRWESLRRALRACASLTEFGVAADQFTGCAAGCRLADHVAAGDKDDPFAIHYCGRLFEALADSVAKQEVQVVVVTGAPLHRYARELAALRRCTVVYDTHNVEYPLWREIRQAAPPPWREAFYSAAVCESLERAERETIGAVHRVWVCSQADRVLVGQVYGAGARERTDVVPNAVAAPRGPAVVPLTHAVFAGRFDYYPNVAAYETLVGEIAPRLRERLPSLPVVVAGAGLGALPAASLPGNVRLVVDPAEMLPLIRSGVMTVPLRLGGGTRFKILEALSAGAPVVSTCKGAEGLELVEGTHYLRAESPAEFADAVARVATDPRLRGALAVSGCELVRRAYSADRLAEIVRRRLADLV
jgi:glycosyltransferase involved in cell wall biosynthesis